jgi:hypothetical protein
MTSNSPRDLYQALMEVIRRRFDLIDAVRSSPTDDLVKAETAAFHGRKIVEGIAFGCLVAIEHGLKQLPRDAKGQWNAENIFERLRKKGLTVLPSPSFIRPATTEEAKAQDVKAVVEGQPDRRLSHDDLIGLYRQLHRWLHEWNPYVTSTKTARSTSSAKALWSELDKLRLFIERHFISIHGEGFFTVLWDSQDNMTKVAALSKIADL